LIGKRKIGFTISSIRWISGANSNHTIVMQMKKGGKAMTKMRWKLCFCVAVLLMTVSGTIADSQFGRTPDGSLKNGCVPSTSIQWDVSEWRWAENAGAEFLGEEGKGWQIKNPEAALRGMVVGDFKFKNEQKIFSFFRKELFGEGFVVRWRARGEEVSLYMPWSLLSPFRKGEPILCRNPIEK